MAVEGIDIIKKFADDTKVGHVMETEADRVKLQEALNALCNWATSHHMGHGLQRQEVQVDAFRPQEPRSPVSNGRAATGDY